jgi:DNA-binding response OmpR family regulator
MNSQRVYSKKKKILICEDNQLAMSLLSFLMEKEGFKSDTAEDGNKALTLLQKTVYDLILMDIHLPFHSGLEVIKYLRSDLKMETPVLVLTAFSDLQMQHQAGELGISGYIVKPFDPSDLIRQISLILKK